MLLGVATGFVMMAMMLVWMVPGSRSRSPSQSPGETASQRRRRYQQSSMTEVSDPEEWMSLHHRESDEEPEMEPAQIGLEQRVQTYHSRLFLVFTMLVDQHFGRWGRRHMPLFEFEAEGRVTDEQLVKSFRQLRVLSLCLDAGRISEVAEMLELVENDGDNSLILAGLTRLEGLLDAELGMELGLTESVAWLYNRYRERMRGAQYDKIRWAGDVFSSDEESMRVAQERALEAIEARMEVAYILNNQEEYEQLERYRDTIGML